mmetsp:Transcript_9232/g.36096  ORF Transcript_9232/g.36096 Transcript_9232/m.36096 type:complete len:244 (+) Transcript_9232:572-1303(+)
MASSSAAGRSASVRAAAAKGASEVARRMAASTTSSVHRWVRRASERSPGSPAATASAALDSDPSVDDASASMAHMVASGWSLRSAKNAQSEGTPSLALAATSAERPLKPGRELLGASTTPAVALSSPHLGPSDDAGARASASSSEMPESAVFRFVARNCSSPSRLYMSRIALMASSAPESLARARFSRLARTRASSALTPLSAQGKSSWVASRMRTTPSTAPAAPATSGELAPNAVTSLSVSS